MAHKHWTQTSMDVAHVKAGVGSPCAQLWSYESLEYFDDAEQRLKTQCDAEQLPTEPEFHDARSTVRATNQMARSYASPDLKKDLRTTRQVTNTPPHIFKTLQQMTP